MPISTCPECEMPMEAKNYEDVLIDMCPSCRGVWLDRGELQKIIAHVRRQEAEDSSVSLDPSGVPPQKKKEKDLDYDYDRDKKRKKKKKSFGLWDALEDLIDL